jgi:hypothetical protein
MGGKKALFFEVKLTGYLAKGSPWGNSRQTQTHLSSTR